MKIKQRESNSKNLFKLDLREISKYTKDDDIFETLSKAVPKIMDHYDDFPPNYADFFVAGYIYGKQKSDLSSLFDIL